MIISHAHRFIFIHCRKTAGSSIKGALAPYLGPDDIVVGGLNEVLRARGRPNRQVVRELRHPLAWYGFARGLAASGRIGEAMNRAVKMRYVNVLGLNPAHAPASRIATAFPAEWHEYFKFCFVRNTFEQVVSDYWWRRRMSGKNFSFDRFLDFLESQETDSQDGALEPGTVQNWNMYTIDDHIAVDFIGEYENLNADFNAALETIGLNADVPIPHEKRRTESHARARNAELTDAQVDRIRQLFHKEIREFDFKPE
jgi:hypothetical protein